MAGVEVGGCRVSAAVCIIRIAIGVAGTMTGIAGSNCSGAIPCHGAGHADILDGVSVTVGMTVHIGTNFGCTVVVIIRPSAGVVEDGVDVLAFVGNGNVIAVSDDLSMAIDAVETVTSADHGVVCRVQMLVMLTAQ